MELTDVYNFYQKMEDENIILSFKGEFTADLLIEQNTEGEEDLLTQKSALIMVKYVGDKIIVRTGNYVKNEGIEALESRLGMVNGLSEDGLRDLYQKKLLSSELSEKGTAGLGLIDIARKSKNKLEHEFVKINDGCSFFCLNVVIE